MSLQSRQLLLALIWLLSLVFLPFVTMATVCPQISNPDCHCVNGFSSSTIQPDITCVFSSQHPSPLFGNNSAASLAIRTLDLSHNALQVIPADFFQGVHTVQKVDLRNNSFRQVPPAVATLGGVVVLDMSHNQLTSLSMPVVGSIPGLQSSDMPENQLKDLSDEEGRTDSAQFQTLKMLNLSINAIQSINGEVFAPMKHLDTLDLSHNQLREVTDTMFSPLMFSLNNLDLSHNLLQAVKHLSLRHLQHLRVLSLAHNPLKKVDGVRFPVHLQSLDLSHCTLTIINHCQLTALPDLWFIGLRGNHLTCTCQLYLLLQWYQDQHHKATNNLEVDNIGSNWTCTNTQFPTTTAASDPLSGFHSSTSTEDGPIGSDLVYVHDLQQCKDTESHCQTLEHAQHHLKGSSQMTVTLDVVSSGNTLMASWTFKDNGEMVDSFRLHYLPEDSKPIDSPLISITARSYMMRPSELEKHFMVCLDVLANQTSIVLQECHSFKDESRNILVGILAGVVFLTPCLVILTYVYVKDKMIQKRCQQQELTEEQMDVEKCAISSHKVPQEDPDSGLKTEDKINYAFDNEEHFTTGSASTGETDSSTGRENQAVRPTAQNTENQAVRPTSQNTENQVVRPTAQNTENQVVRSTAQNTENQAVRPTAQNSLETQPEKNRTVSVKGQNCVVNTSTITVHFSLTESPPKQDTVHEDMTVSSIACHTCGDQTQFKPRPPKELALIPLAKGAAEDEASAGWKPDASEDNTKLKTAQQPGFALVHSSSDSACRQTADQHELATDMASNGEIHDKSTSL